MLHICKIHIPHYFHGVIIIKQFKDQIQNSKNRRSGGKSFRIHETYKITMMPHGSHIYAKEFDMEKATICAYPHSDHALRHRKCGLQCCFKCPSINLPDQETDDQYSNTSSSVSFHIFHLIAHFYNTWQDSVNWQLFFSQV